MAVQISGNDITVPRDGTFNRNVSIAGTLTYEDVTNVDSIGIVTARNGIEVGARPGVAASISVDGNMIVSGITTFGGSVDASQGIIIDDSITHRNDTNTKIRFPSDDTITAETGGTERLRVDSVGTLMVGHDDKRDNFNSASSTEHAPIIQLEGTNQKRAMSITASGGNDGGILMLARQDGSVGANGVVSSGDQIGRVDFQASGGTNMEVAAQITAEVDGTPGDNDMPGRLLFKTTADGANSTTERLRINSAGNVRIGEGDANADLDIYGAGTQTIHVGSTNASGATIVLDGDSNGDGSGADYAYINHDSSGNLNIVAANPGDDSQMIFNTGGGSENARFLRSGSHGHMYINTTSQVSSAMLSLTGNGTCVIGSKVTADNNQDHISFRNPNGEVGTVSTNGSNTSFNTSSDYRLKENEVTISDAISKVKQLKPYTFNFKADSNTTIDGFFAHEAQEVVPYAVTGEKDAEKMQSMDYGKLTPLLTAALQEAISEIETLKTEVAALKSQLNN